MPIRTAYALKFHAASPLRLSHALRGLLSAVLLLCLTAPALHAAGYEDEPAYKELRRREAKVLARLLDEALEDGYRRQAWYLATRLLDADPSHVEASDLLDSWDPDEIAAGKKPDDKWIKKRDRALQKLGDEWFAFGELLEAAGMDPVQYYPVNKRAHAYGAKAPNLHQALEQAGYMWLGTLLDREKAKVKELLGDDLFDKVSYPPEYDDDYLTALSRWPGCIVVEVGAWQIVTDHSWDMALRLARHAQEVDAWLVETFKGARDKRAPKQHIYVFKDIKQYDEIGLGFVGEEHETDYKLTSRWFRPSQSTGRRRRRRRRAGVQATHGIVCTSHRHHDFVTEQQMLQAIVARMVAHAALSAKAGGVIRGRGAWLLESFAEAMKGLVKTEKDDFELDPQACPGLAAAANLESRGELLTWEHLFELNEEGARTADLVDAKAQVGGTDREIKQVNVAYVQGAAMVVGIIKQGKRKGPKAMAELLAALYKRDSLPDVDKTMRARKGSAVAWAREAMSAIPK